MKKITYTVNFYYAEDQAAPKHKTKRTNALENAAIARLNEIWRSQSGVELVKGTSQSLVLTGDWGAKIASDKVKDLLEDNDPPDERTIAVIFVWSAEAPDGYSYSGGSLIIQDIVSDATLYNTIAHEVGHTMGLWEPGVDSDYIRLDRLHRHDVMAAERSADAGRVRKLQTDLIQAEYDK